MNKPKNGKKAPKIGKNGKPKHIWWKIVLAVIGAIIALGIGVFAYLWTTTSIPDPESTSLASNTTVYYSDGTTKIGSFSEENRDIIECSTLPSYVGQAIVASEDRSFYTNNGIDIVGIARAFINNVTTGSRQGGSTITQQYAERYYLGETTSYKGKLHEAILALKIAQTQSKDEILCNYMNTIYFGRGAYGIQAAAQAYYGVDAKDLTLSQAATLAGIIPAPSTWNPGVNPDQAKKRYERVLKIMLEDGYITQKEKDDAKFPDVIAEANSNDYQGENGYLLTTVKNELINSGAFTADDLETGGYKIITTLDKSMQDEMTQVGNERPDGMPSSIQVGGIAVDPRSGEVKAMYGGEDYLTKQLNNATQATFQPGSTMKPFGLLGAAMDDVSFQTLFNGNSGLEFETTNGVWASVPNALNTNWGYINLNQATANSVNTVFMNVNQNLTPQKFAEIAHTAGITSDIDENTLYNILGINATTAWDLAQGHSTIANNGKKTTLHIVDKVLKDDKEMYKADTSSETVFDANDCALVQNAMLGTTTYGTAAGVATQIGRPVAGKSGTANDETAASFVGYTPQLLNVWAIWNPADDGSAQVVPEFAGYGVSSTGYPSHLFSLFMQQALQGQEVIAFPTAVDNGKIGGPNGKWGLGSSSTKTEDSSSTTTEQEATPSPSKTASEEASQEPPATVTESPSASATTEPTTAPTTTAPTTPVTPTDPATTPATQTGDGTAQ